MIPDAPSLLDALKPIPTYDQVPNSHSTLPVEEVLAAGASTSFQRLGTLITSSSNPMLISAAPNTHIPTRSGLPDNRSDLGDPDHQLLDEHWRPVMWGGTSDEPLDVHTNNPRPSATLHSASRSTQTAQNEDLDSIENSAGISELPQNNIEIASAPPVSYSPIHDQTDSQVPTSDFRRDATRERESQLIAKLNKSKSKRKIRKFPSLPSDPDLSGHSDKSFPQQTETVIPQFSVNQSLGEHHPAGTKHGRISAEYDRRKAALQLLSSNTLNTQNYVPRLKCIDERAVLGAAVLRCVESSGPTCCATAFAVGETAGNCPGAFVPKFPHPEGGPVHDDRLWTRNHLTGTRFFFGN
ncbi:hypothetical protein PCANC_08885 [Puccinia coronata f. sp. avenae]|uniref:Uncharacterized protein n=1 Tax=Puccinia coronata f. sp. avenae TaxID=200324 RepID=A0A2N5VS41_9BASI|nr:hypothetical protein PCANC_08885 [Puccinia coronata f. sp. avenae]